MDQNTATSRLMPDSMMDEDTIFIKQESPQNNGRIPKSLHGHPVRPGLLTSSISSSAIAYTHPPIQLDAGLFDFCSQNPQRSDYNIPHISHFVIAPTPPPKQRDIPSAPRKFERSLASHEKTGTSTTTVSPHPQKLKCALTTLARIRATTTNSTDSPLLRLPGELRNRIYRFTLIRHRNIEITATNWPTHQPALLQTCRQTRVEALPLFYVENTISAEIRDWDPTVKQRMHELANSHRLTMSLRSHHFMGKENWANLLAWLKGVFEGRLHGISDCVGKERDAERKVIGVMFLMARRGRARGAVWGDVRDLLLAQAEALRAVNPAWVLN